MGWREKLYFAIRVFLLNQLLLTLAGTDAVGVFAAVAVSEQIRTFCKQRGMDGRTSYFVSLSVEEIAVNIIKHGFIRDKQSRNIDVRLVIKERNRLIRIRDNCVQFDPTEFLKLHQVDSPESHIGIRMVMGTVTEANYIHTLGLNNLMLRL